MTAAGESLEPQARNRSPTNRQTNRGEREDAVRDAAPSCTARGLNIRRRRPSTMDEDLVERARNAVTERAELPGMSLIEHLEELRRRLIHSAVYLVIGFFVAYGFHDRFALLAAAAQHSAHTSSSATRARVSEPD